MGKSWLLLQITTAIASGTVTLVPSDHPPCGDVLYLALEDNPRRLQRRLAKYFGAQRECWPARLKLATEWRRLDQGGLDDIREWCASVEKPTLVAIDTLKKVRKPKAQNQTDYDADYGACQGLQELAGNISGLSIIVACHDRKMAADDVFDTVSGTLGLTGGVDAIAIMKRAGQGTTLHIEGRDLPEPIEKAVSFDRETCRWMILGEAAEVQRSAERTRVLKALADTPEGLSTSEIMAAAEISTRNATDILLSKMAMTGEIERAQTRPLRPAGNAHQANREIAVIRTAIVAQKETHHDHHFCSRRPTIAAAATGRMAVRHRSIGELSDTGTGYAPDEDVCAFDGWYADWDDAHEIFGDWCKRFPNWIVAVVEKDEVRF